MSKILLAPLAVAAALMLAACGGDAPPATPAATPPADAASRLRQNRSCLYKTRPP